MDGELHAAWLATGSCDSFALEADSGVSVVINTLTRRVLLEDVLDSLHAQHVENFEMIVVNGSSSDDTIQRSFGVGTAARDRPKTSTEPQASNVEPTGPEPVFDISGVTERNVAFELHRLDAT